MLTDMRLESWTQDWSFMRCAAAMRLAWLLAVLSQPSYV
jgi:hypothetical protein